VRSLGTSDERGVLSRSRHVLVEVEREFDDKRQQLALRAKRLRR